MNSIIRDLTPKTNKPYLTKTRFIISIVYNYIFSFVSYCTNLRRLSVLIEKRPVICIKVSIDFYQYSFSSSKKRFRKFCP
jgi:hypothetical protein